MDASLFSKYTQLHKPTKTTSERAEMIGFLTDRLNRQKTGRKYPYAFLGMKLAHLSIRDLYYLKGICEKSSNWAKTFWGSLKVKLDKDID